MAVLTPLNAWESAKLNVRKMPLDDTSTTPTYRARLLDSASKMMWNLRPWRWTIGALTSFPLVAGTTQYTLPSFPSDFLRLYKCWMSDGVSTVRYFQTQPYSPTTSTYNELPVFVAHIIGTSNLRVWGVPPALAGTTQTFEGLYKKASTNITESNITSTTVLGFEDDYFPVYEQLVQYYAFVYAMDSRAGGSEYDPQLGKVTYKGQLATAMAYVEEWGKRDSDNPEWDYRPGQKADKR